MYDVVEKLDMVITDLVIERQKYNENIPCHANTLKIIDDLSVKLQEIVQNELTLKTCIEHDYVKFKPTVFGLSVYGDCKLDSHGYHVTPFWNFMVRFGPYVRSGIDLPKVVNGPIVIIKHIGSNNERT